MQSTTTTAPSVKLTGCEGFRLRILLSMLSGRPVKITDIRAMDESPGLRDYEASLLRLADKFSNGAKISINETGTILRFVPGELIGGEVTHDCPASRSVSYFLEFAAVLAPFCKQPLNFIIRGNTHSNDDNSVDSFKSVTLVVLLRLIGSAFSTEQGAPEIKVERRGVGVDGSVKFFCPIVPKSVTPIDLTGDEGKVKRIRGVCWTSQVSTQFSAGVIDACRAVLNPCLSDVWIYTDAVKAPTAAGYGLSLVSETDKGVVKCSGAMRNDDEPRALGQDVAEELLAEISKGGLVDSSHQWLVVLFMALSADYKVSKAMLGSTLAPYTILCMQAIRDFLGVKFKISSVIESEKLTIDGETEDDTPTTTMSKSENIKLECIGANLINGARRTF